MFTDDQLLPISALQHLVFCERQCALIHLERMWSENSLTAEGQLLHRKTNKGRDETHSGNRIVRSIDLVSRRLGLIGKSDVVEFRPPDGITPVAALNIVAKNNEQNRFSHWQIIPIEYKRGKPKTNPIWGDCDRVQLCAQVLCLEEMLEVTIEQGQLFYGEKRRRLDIAIDRSLRDRTESCVLQLHQLLSGTKLPLAVNDRRCKRCSLIETCMPEQTHSPTKASRWILKQLELHRGTDE